jgi:hypothetical protein
MNQPTKKFLAVVLLITCPIWMVPIGVYFILFGFFEMAKQVYSMSYAMVDAWFNDKK